MDEPQIYVDLAKAVEANETAVANGKKVDKNTTTIEVLKTGDWKSNKGNFSLTANDLQEMATNFDSDVRPHSSTHGLPIDEEHDKKAALGWLHAPRVVANDKGGSTLLMDAKWTDAGLAKVKDGTYKFFSPEVHFKHVDPEGKLATLRNVLMGGGVTNRPLFKSLAGIPALTASDGSADEDNKIYFNDKEPTVDLTTIRAKKNAEVTEEERKVLDAAKDQLTEAEKAEFYPEAAAPAPAPAAAAPAAPAEPAAPAPAAGVTANDDGSVSLSASELETLQANAAKGLEASEKLRKNEAEREVTEMCFSESDGFKLPQDMRGSVTDLWLEASEDQKSTLKKIFEATKPMLDANDRRIMGSDQTGNGTAVDLLEEKVAELQANDANIGYGEAVKKVRRQNPDLAKEADSEEGAAMPQVHAR